MDLAPEEREQEIIQWLVEMLSSVLGVGPDEIDLDKPFSYYGLGSAEAVMIVGDLEAWLHCTFPSELSFDFPTIGSLAKHLGSELDKYLDPSP